nr:MauE/DoxX family redox-associated membrane protein [uncultured Mucilaginibacter sp.]
MESKVKRFLKISVSIIALLWFYAAVSKLMNFGHFREAIQKQPLWPAMKPVVTYGLLPFEIILGMLLITDKRVTAGLYLSAASFLLFFGYTALILSKVFGGVPCACGGLIERMGWTFHLWFNLGFFTLTLITIIIHKKKGAR